VAVAVRLNDNGYFECAQCGSRVNLLPSKRPTFLREADRRGRDEFVLQVRDLEIHRCGVDARRARIATRDTALRGSDHASR
jgi:hypothetical protein